MHQKSPRKRSAPLNQREREGKQALELLSLDPDARAGPGGEESIIYCSQMSKFLHGEMKCTASASFVETSAEGYILLCFIEKRKSKAALYLWKLDCENIFCNLNRRRDQSTASATCNVSGF